MRIVGSFRLVLALSCAAASARAAAPARLAAPAWTPAPLFAPAALPAPASLGLALPAAPAGLVPALLSAPAQASPLRLPSAAPVPAAVAPVPAAVAPVSAAAAPAPASPQAPSPEESARRYADFFDGAAPATDGEAVSPRLALGPGPALRQPLQLDAVRHAVSRALPALRESVALGGWNGPHTTLDESCCGDAAPKLALLLRAQGVPARLVEAEFHYYVLLDLPDGQIVVDPTVRQFFGKKHAPRSIPQVFVGGVGDLTGFFQRHAASKTTGYDPRRIYFRESAVREAELRALEAAVRAGGAAEHEPLRRFLGLPPAALRLIIP